MLNRQLFFSAIFLSALGTAALPTPVAAQQSGYTQVIFNLETDGYRVVEMTTTLLGRMRIVARNNVHLREIVVSRATGEIKSDIILQIFAVADSRTKPTNKLKATVPGTGPGTGTSTGSVSASAGGVSVGAGSGGVSASAGGVSASAGSGGASASVGGRLGN